MPTPNQYSAPGQSPASFTAPRDFLWSSHPAIDAKIAVNDFVSADTVDAGNVPTTYVREGTLLSRQATGSRFLTNWLPDQQDGREVFAGVLSHELSMVEPSGATATSIKSAIVWTRVPVKLSGVLVLGDTPLGKVFEFATRQALFGAGCYCDDDPNGLYSGDFTRVQKKAGAYAVSRLDSGSAFISTAAAAYTLPAVEAGIVLKFTQTAAATMSITGAAGSIVAANNAAATSLTFSTAGQQIGAAVIVRGTYTAPGTLRWIVEQVSQFAPTVA
jgi:hypothetical protein